MILLNPHLLIVIILNRNIFEASERFIYRTYFIRPHKQTSRKRKMSGMSVTACTHLGKYELEKTIGEGSFAKVKFSKNVENKNHVAIKILDCTTYYSIYHCLFCFRGRLWKWKDLCFYRI